jgi:hypothetical protein
MTRVLPSEALTVLDKLFPWAADQGEGQEKAIGQGQALTVAALVGVVGQIPSGLLVLESEDRAAFHASIEVLRNALATWQGPKDHNVTYIPGFGKRNPVTLIRRALTKCPDEVIPPETTDLPFLQGDPQLRDALRQDLAQSERDLLNGDWKSSTVLAGSVIEALLLWALNQPACEAAVAAATEAPGGPLNKWDLSEYIAVAEEVGVIFTPETITEVRLTQKYRNLIHPGRAQRLGQRCDRGTAQVALAAVSHVVADLAVKFP